MASRVKTYKFGADLDDLADLRAKHLGYKSGAAYIKALIRYDSLCCAQHSLTIPWSNLALEEQDQIDAKLLSRAKNGKGMTGKIAKTLNWKTDL
jgi:hypothetical protein